MRPLGRLLVERRTGDESIMADGHRVATLREFWSWAYSDPADNTVRGALAEYLVATALGSASGTRAGWDAVDIRTPEGWAVEVKSAAYLQSWDQDDFSDIVFSIAPSAGWDARTNTQSTETRRNADVYVFCLLHHRDKKTLDPLDLGQWTFYVVPTRTLDERRPGQKKIGLAGLKRLRPVSTDHPGLRKAVVAGVRQHRR